MSATDYQPIQSELQQRLQNCPPPPRLNGSKGIVICGGGYWYFTNAYINIRLIQALGCKLPIELWMFTEECDAQIEALCTELGVRLRVVDADEIADRNAENPRGARWQWVLKPYAIIHSAFTQVLMLDADSFPVRDPAFLFQSAPYLLHGAMFWPDFGVMEESRAIWEIMGVPFRKEAEFETGQILIDKRRCWEPLQLTLWMNQRADFFYQIIWGDKDTFRFAWHKYGRSFAMCPFPLMALDFPGGPQGTGVMCQHDFEGNRLFQHRNLAKWNLCGDNPRIAGYLYDAESRRFLQELRQQWEGRVNLHLPTLNDLPVSLRNEARKIERDLRNGSWLLEDGRTIVQVCCGGEISVPGQRQPQPWTLPPPPTVPPEALAAPAIPERPNWADPAQSGPVYVERKGSRSSELRFQADQSIVGGWQSGCYWWSLQRGAGQRWMLVIHNVDRRLPLKMLLTKTGRWETKFQSEHMQGSISLYRVQQAYPALLKARRPALTRPARQPIHVAQHAFGIGDAITAVYACMGAVRAGQPIIFHTRVPWWFTRIREPGLTITNQAPPPGTPDLNVDYVEQLRYAQQKTAWYAQFITTPSKRGPRPLTQTPFAPARPKLDRKIHIRRLDFPRYVIVSPFAAAAARDWLPGHWRRLAFLLDQAGIAMVIIGAKSDAERIMTTFDRTQAFWAIDHSPAWVTDAMLGAQAVIGLDSGMVHLAGLLNVPTICLHAHLPPAFLFSSAPSIHSLTPATDCVFCRWQMERQFQESCREMCSALASIGPEQVMGKLREIVRPTVSAS